MKYEATLTAEGDADNIYKVFEAEDKDFKNNRANYKVLRRDEEIVFEINAQDASALRAVLDAIAKKLKVYEKMKEV